LSIAAKGVLQYAYKNVQIFIAKNWGIFENYGVFAPARKIEAARSFYVQG